MSNMPTYELEDEFSPSFEIGTLDSDAECEEFFGTLSRYAKRAASSPLLRRAAISAARAAVGTMQDGAFKTTLGSLIPQQEFEEEWEAEYEINPYLRLYPKATMERLGQAAMNADTEEEAEAFIGALIPLAAQLLPKLAPAVMKVAPSLIRGAANVAKTFRQSPELRPLVRTVPTIVRNTARQIAQQSQNGRANVSPDQALRILAQQTLRTTGTPRRAVAAYRQARSVAPRVAAARPAASVCPCCGRSM